MAKDTGPIDLPGGITLYKPDSVIASGPAGNAQTHIWTDGATIVCPEEYTIVRQALIDALAPATMPAETVAQPAGSES